MFLSLLPVLPTCLFSIKHYIMWSFHSSVSFLLLIAAHTWGKLFCFVLFFSYKLSCIHFWFFCYDFTVIFRQRPKWNFIRWLPGRSTLAWHASLQGSFILWQKFRHYSLSGMLIYHKLYLISWKWFAYNRQSLEN